MKINKLWRNARDYFAGVYGDSRSVFRVMDENDGTLIGRGLAPWKIPGGSECSTEYHIRFAAKDNKARVQFELIEGVPPTSPCSGWPLPSQDGYDSIKRSFAMTAKEVEGALKGGGGKNKFKDF